MGGAGIFNIYNTSISAFAKECFKHTALHFPVLNDLLHSNSMDNRRMTPTMLCYTNDRAQLICLANELDMPTRERGHQALVFF
jgi:hypothetical protein